MNLKFISEATVRGRLEFPLDMLRYDSCMPCTTADVCTIQMTLQPGGYRIDGQRATWLVRVKKFVERKVHPDTAWTPARWRSFGCDLIIDEHVR